MGQYHVYLIYSYTLLLVDKDLLVQCSVGGDASDLIAGENTLDDIVHTLRTTTQSNSNNMENHDMDCSIGGGSSSDKFMSIAVQHERNDCSTDAEMKCEGRDSIVTSPVDVMDDIHGSTSTTANKQSCSSFPSLEEEKGGEDVELLQVDQAQSAPSSLEGGGDNSIEVDFTNSGDDMNDELDASQHLEGTTMEEDGTNEMDTDELVEEASSSPSDTAAFGAAVEACNNNNAGGSNNGKCLFFTLRLFNVCICLLIHSQSEISKAGKRKLEDCIQEENENKKIRSDTAMNKDDTELDASPPNAAVNDVVVERAKDDVCVDSKVETTRLSPMDVSDIGKDNNDDGK